MGNEDTAAWMVDIASHSKHLRFMMDTGAEGSHSNFKRTCGQICYLEHCMDLLYTI